MKEIGGYFGLEELIDNEYYKHLLRLNTGRNALLYLVKVKGIKKLFIPFYLCDSVSNMLQRHGYGFDYYHIGENFHPRFNERLDKDAYLYVVNYYGQLDNEVIASLHERYERIIVDNTQAFFQEPVKGVDTIYSCRKFFGVPDGAYLATDCVLNQNIEVDVSRHRMIHLLGRLEGSASEYYRDFKDNDASFAVESLKYMSKLTRNILGAIDYQNVIQSRGRNFEWLHDRLGNTNKLSIKIPYGPFAYPYYVENGIEIRKRFAEVKIYIPTLWPNVLSDYGKNSVERTYAANILPLPCDQRYGVDDMRRVVKELLT